VSIKRYCLVPARWTLEDYSRHTCDDHSHSHLSKSQVYELEVLSLIEWLRRPEHRKEKGILKQIKTISHRGLSCRVGGELVSALCDYSRRGIAEVMLANINQRREEQSVMSSAL